MSTLNKTGFRIAGAGAAAAALTLAAAAPAFAEETDYAEVTGWLVNESALTFGPNPVVVALDAPEELAADGGITSVEVVAYPVDDSVVQFTPDIENNASCGALPEDAGYGDGAVGCGLTDEAGLKEFPYSLLINANLASVPADEPFADYVVEVFVNGATEPSSVTESDLDISEDPEGDGEELPETPGEDDEAYSYQFLDQVLEGAEPGSTVSAEPQFKVAEAPAEDRAATIVTFTDSVSVESIIDDTWRSTDRAYAEAGYDNCHVDSWGTTCLLIDFTPEAGTTYGLADDSPLTFAITDEGVTEDDVAAYWAEDLTDAELGDFIDATGINLDYNEHSNLLSLVETEASEDGDFYTGYGLFLFLTDIDDVDELPGHEIPGGSGQLPSTGSSSIVLISSAAAAMLAGAVVFFLLRRRKTEADWE